MDKKNKTKDNDIFQNRINADDLFFKSILLK